MCCRAMQPLAPSWKCSRWRPLAAVGALVEMQGIVRMMQQISSRVVSEQRDKVGILKKVGIPKTATTWWTTLRTLLAHRCWRYFPKLAVKLPEILLGGSFNGVKLQSETFHEPGESPDQPLAVFSAGQSNTWKHRSALRRSEVPWRWDLRHQKGYIVANAVPIEKVWRQAKPFALPSDDTS